MSDKVSFTGAVGELFSRLDAITGLWKYSCILIIEDYTDYQAVRRMQKSGYRVEVEIKRWRKKRTLPQNAIFHAIVRLIAVGTGQPFELVKSGLKQAYGAHEKDLKGRLIPMETSRMTTVEMAPLITGALTEAWEQGIDTREQEKDWKELLNNPPENDVVIAE